MKITKKYLDIIEEILNQRFEENVKISNSKHYYSSELIPLKWEIRWSSIGSQKPEVAKDFVKDLNQAIKIAEFLNEKHLVIDWEDDSDDDLSNDVFMQVVNKYAKMLKDKTLSEKMLFDLLLQEA